MTKSKRQRISSARFAPESSRVIQGDARAGFGDAVERVQALLVGNAALGNLENQLSGAGAQSRLLRRVVEAAPAEDLRRNVDGDIRLGVRVEPDRSAPTATVSITQ